MQHVNHSTRMLRLFALIALCLVAAFTSFTPNEAQACGGFFCSLQNPVDQAGEQILFAVEGTEVTAYIQIQYQGTADEFSWVLPLPAVPDFSIGTDALFSTLRQMTDPRFELEWQTADNCSPFDECANRFAFDDFDADGGAPAPNSAGGEVDILAEGTVGPFDYKVIQSEQANAVFTWLNDNGYDQPPASHGLLERYTADGYVFVALKLLNDASVNEIQPIVLKYNDPMLACIPLRLTSIAATSDMPIRSWVLASARAIPMNYFHVILNANAYDWFRCASQTGNGPWGWWGGDTDCSTAYTDLVTRATDVVNGHGFVTEYAGTTDIMDDMLYTAGRFNLTSLQSQTNAARFVEEMLNQGFPRNGQVQDMIRKHIPKPTSGLPAECQEDRDFYAVWNLDTCLGYMPSDWTFDPVAFAEELDERIITPLTDAQALFDSHPYMTRLFTTMSPAEMDRDPLFSFNAGLPDVSNVHRAAATPICATDSTTDLQGVQLTYPDGASVYVSGAVDQNSCTFAPDDRPIQPALAMLQVMNEEGAPDDVDTNDSEAITSTDERIGTRRPNTAQSAVIQIPGTTIGVNTSTFGSTTRSSTDGSGCSCTVAREGNSNSMPFGGLLLLVGFAAAVAAARKEQ